MNSPPYQYRVTKYNPRFRDSSGAYTRDDWTAISDIGKSFSGVVLTEEEYHKVEKAHLTTAQAFLQEAGALRLQAKGVENHGSHPEAPKEGQWLEAEQAVRTLRHVLREEFWCRLEGASCFLHVGWDYYMFVGVPNDCSRAVQLASGLGLFVEPMLSPYAENAA